mgnify:CR=1 FL=1
MYYVYLYSNGNITSHKRMIANKTILKEANGANKVSIYKCNEYETEKMLFDDLLAGHYVTTLLLN